MEPRDCLCQGCGDNRDAHVPFLFPQRPVRQGTVKPTIAYSHAYMQFPERVPQRERWQELCAKAAVESNPEKLDYLIEQILALLQEREERLKQTDTAR
jgi:hypothetical protein